MEKLTAPLYSNMLNNPRDFELIAVMELLSFEDISFTSINYYLSAIFLSDEPTPSMLRSSIGNRRLLINYQGPMDDLEPHDVVLFFPHKIQSVAITSSDKTHRINEFTRNDIHVLIIERIISSQIKIEANAIDRNRESHYPSVKLVIKVA
ncbi:hypothetical protein [Lonsdalea populi]|uniref:hypothetical protein n=1 Tax=Lonsdalea populi TaxID=1172565 RepID=UPI000A1F47F2|nr:hypothetical protein [Lonsdalea populi]OSN02387.1 hypothetical protein AU499_02190 [Lonsdalea populi]QPQ23003.1 hypothetical protein I6N93_09910 [Lonsdalea populi]RAT41878.1 hypothetical protein AU494_11970 [Lonsdalea populi]RAT43733.1 hypothetical protein AU495_09320 [Lonsdalea populi]RAT59165.1 hypothetical protein AU500_00375 [Lonsdalea populi]